MILLSDIHSIQRLIAHDEMSEAIEKMLSFAENGNVGWLTEALIISMELYGLQKAVIGGRLTWAEEQTTKRLLAYRLAELLKAIISNNGTAFQQKANSEEKFFLKRA